MKSVFAEAMGIRSQKSRLSKIVNDAPDDMTKSQISAEEGNNFQMFKFEAARRRRVAICFVLEEKERYLGIPLSELRKNLIVYNMLDKLGLL